MSSRLFQGMSETFETLHNLVHKGVKVVMDIPYELWNETSAEVADLKKQVGPSAHGGCCAPGGGDGSAAEEGQEPRDLGPLTSGCSWLRRTRPPPVLCGLRLR